MKYFDKMGFVEYAISQNQSVILTNISKNSRVKSYSIGDNVGGYLYYNILDGERPDNVSYEIYGTPIYWWSLFLINTHLRSGLKAWPLSSIELARKIEKQYQGKVLIGLRENNSVPKDTTNMAGTTFQIGETVEGATSGARGRVAGKNIQMNQIILKDISGTFSGDEDIIGLSSADVMNYNADYTYDILDYKDAPKRYSEERFDFVRGDDSDLSIISYENQEYLDNEELKEIRYISPDDIEDFVTAVEEALRN